jgi:hypothetical protein
MRANPKLLMLVLDDVTEEQRRLILRETIAGTGDPMRRQLIRSFDQMTAQDPARRTSVTWLRLRRSQLP